MLPLLVLPLQCSASPSKFSSFRFSVSLHGNQLCYRDSDLNALCALVYKDLRDDAIEFIPGNKDLIHPYCMASVFYKYEYVRPLECLAIDPYAIAVSEVNVAKVLQWVHNSPDFNSLYTAIRENADLLNGCRVL